MSVRFKFRSSLGFDSLDLGGRPSIPVGDLRARILEQKNLEVCGDFRLVIFDASTGEAYENEDDLIPAGSDVVVKRVPAVLEKDDACDKGCAAEHADFSRSVAFSPSENVDMDNFDDFGNDLLTPLNVPPQNFDSDEGSVNSIPRRDKDHNPCLPKLPASRCQNPEQSSLSVALSKENVGENYDTELDVKDNMSRSQLHKMEEHRESDKFPPGMTDTDLPTELQCSLCNKIFKDAVMIPCCQHSFCHGCIRTALADKGRCPQCSSTKFRIEDLLPNLSLRHAIGHFLEAQIPTRSDQLVPRYAPDGESGIQAKEVSGALSIQGQEQTLLRSPSVAGKGLEQVVIESPCESQTGTKQMVPGSGSNVISLGEDGRAKSTTCLPKKKTQNENTDMTRLGGSGSSSKLAQTQKGEANATARKKKGVVAASPDASGTGFPPCNPRKGDRYCFMCGSPDHLVRDCPSSSNPFSSLHQAGSTAFHGGFPAYGPAYWPGGAFPYVSMYGAAQMLAFDPARKSTQPYCIPYVSPMYGGLPLTWMGGFGAPMAAGAAQAASHGGAVEPFEGERRRRDQTPEDDDGGDDNSRDDLREPSPRGRSSGSGGFSGEENPRKRPTDENLTAEKRPRSQKSGDPEEISERESRRRRRRSSRDRGDRSGGGGDDRRRRDQRERDDAGERRKRRRRRRRRRSEPSPAPPEPPEKPEDDDRWQLVDGLDEPYGPLYRRRRRK